MIRGKLKKLLLGEETEEHDKDLFQFVDRALQSGIPERKATLEVGKKTFYMIVLLQATA